MISPMKALVPEDLAIRRRPPYLMRAAFTAARHSISPHTDDVESIAKALYGDDGVTAVVVKAAVTPGATTGTSALAGAAVGDFVSSLVPISAAAKLFEVCTRVDLSGVNTISFPSRSGVIDPAAIPWVSQGAPIPVGQFQLTSASLGPVHKLAIITALTRECAEHASGEMVLTTLLKENAALSLDASLFSNAAGTADRPAGLLNGITPLTAATAGDDAMNADLSALANAISDDTVGLAFVAHPAQAAAIKLRRGSTFSSDIPVWATLGVTEGTVIALDPSAVVSAFGSEPEIVSSREALVHMESTAPLPIVTGAQGSGVAASPTRSLFQTDCIGLRLILRAAWALRAPGSVAWMQNVTW